MPPGPAATSAIASGAGFAGLTVVVTRTELLPGERAVTRWLLRAVEPWLGPLSGALDDAFTDWSATAVYVALVPVVWWLWGRWATAAFAVAGAATAVSRLAAVVERPRPRADLSWGQVVAGQGGYPSGHVVYMVLVCGTLAAFAWGQGRVWARVVAGVLVLLAAVTGLTRVLVLDHWPADVVGAYLVAWPALVLVVWLHRRAPGPLATVRDRLERGGQPG